MEMYVKICVGFWITKFQMLHFAHHVIFTAYYVLFIIYIYFKVVLVFSCLEIQLLNQLNKTTNNFQQRAELTCKASSKVFGVIRRSVTRYYRRAVVKCSLGLNSFPVLCSF